MQGAAYRSKVTVFAILSLKEISLDKVVMHSNSLTI